MLVPVVSNQQPIGQQQSITNQQSISNLQSISNQQSAISNEKWPVSFVDVADRAGLREPATYGGIDRKRFIIETNGAGVALLDYDNDGWIDALVLNGTRLKDGTREAETYAPGRAPLSRLYRNNRDGTFSDVTSRAGLTAVGWASSVCAGDYDNDGWLDLFITYYGQNVLYRNRGDGRIDIYVACDSTASILYRNNGDGTFSDTAVESGIAYSENGTQQAGMGVAIGDYNADGLVDLLKTHFADDIPALYRNLGKGIFEDVAAAAGLGVLNRHVEWGAGMPDLDNDGRPDIVYVTGNVYPEVEHVLRQSPHRGPRVVFRNMDGVRFEDVTGASGPAPLAAHSSRGAAFGDFDNDGDVDILVFNMNEPPSLLRNDYTGPNHWIAVKLAGTTSNRAALGATVRLTAGGRTQAQVVLSQSSYYSHDDLRLHFGLGSSTAADAIEIRWPSGRIDRVRNVRGGRVVALREGAIDSIANQR